MSIITLAIIAVVMIVVAMIAFVVHAVRQRPENVEHRKAKSRHRIQRQRERQASQDALLVYHYTMRLIDWAIANSRNQNGQVTINLYDRFLISGKEIFDSTKQRITICRLSDALESCSGIFFEVEGEDIRSFCYFDDQLSQFIREVEANGNLETLGNTKGCRYMPIESMPTTGKKFDLRTIDKVILCFAYELCTSSNRDDYGQLHYDNSLITIVAEPIKEECTISSTELAAKIFYHPEKHGEPQLVYRHAYGHNLYFELLDEVWLDSLAASYHKIARNK